MIFHWRLSDNKSPQVSRILLNIQANLNNAVIWMVSTLPLISKSSILCTNLLVTEISASIKTSITVTFMRHFFSVLKQGIGIYLSFCFPSVLTRGQLERQNPLFGRFSLFFFFFLLTTRSGPQAEIR